MLPGTGGSVRTDCLPIADEFAHAQTLALRREHVAEMAC